jgi:hypothetical protein
MPLYHIVSLACLWLMAQCFGNVAAVVRHSSPSRILNWTLDPKRVTTYIYHLPFVLVPLLLATTPTLDQLDLPKNIFPAYKMARSSRNVSILPSIICQHPSTFQLVMPRQDIHAWRGIYFKKQYTRHGSGVQFRVSFIIIYSAFRASGGGGVVGFCALTVAD